MNIQGWMVTDHWTDCKHETLSSGIFGRYCSIWYIYNVKMEDGDYCWCSRQRKLWNIEEDFLVLKDLTSHRQSDDKCTCIHFHWYINDISDSVYYAHNLSNWQTFDLLQLMRHTFGHIRKAYLSCFHQVHINMHYRSYPDCHFVEFASAKWVNVRRIGSG